MRNFDYNDYLGLSGLQSGDIVDVSSGLSSVKRFADENGLLFDANSLIDELIRMVGEQGTVMIRSYSWSFCKGIAYNIKETPSDVGALGNVALRRLNFMRTRHPIYSWMVYGYYQKELCDYDNIDGTDRESIFPFLEQKKAKQLVIGKLQNAALSIGHYAEVQVGVPYRKRKYFEGDYTDIEGNCSRRKYSIYVRPLNIEVEYVISNYNTIQYDAVLSEMIMNRTYMNALPIVTVDLAKLVSYTKNDIVYNDGKHIMQVNGIPGIKGCGIDWSVAEF